MEVPRSGASVGTAIPFGTGDKASTAGHNTVKSSMIASLFHMDIREPRKEI
jgi:hypothetical protein